MTIVPLNKAQEGLWTEWQSDPLSTSWILALQVAVASSSHISDVLSVVQGLVDRHEVLRATIHSSANEALLAQQPLLKAQDAPVMQIHPAADYVPLVDIRGISSIPSDDLQSLIREPINLRTQGAVRFIVLKTSDDPLALSTLSQEIHRKLCNPEIDDRELYSAVSSHYHEFAEHERLYLTSSLAVNHQNFVRSSAERAENIRWRCPGSPSATSSTVMINCPLLDTADLEAVAHSFNTTWFRLLLALVGLAVKRLVESKDPCIHVAFSGRPSSFAATVGHFANLVPVPIPAATTEQSLRRIRLSNYVRTVTDLMTDASEVSRYPYLDLVRYLMASGKPLQPQVTITHAPRLGSDTDRLHPIRTNSDLYFCFQDSADGKKVGMTVYFNPQRLSETAVNEMQRGLLSSVHSIVSTAPAELDSIIITGPSTSTLVEVPGKMAASPCQLSLHHTSVTDLIRSHAASDPAKLALCNAEIDASITYGSLIESVDALSAYLHMFFRHALGRDKIIALRLARDFRAVQWMLSVLQLGTAFVCIDPEQPAERQRYILENCGASLVIGDSSLSGETGYLLDSTLDHLDVTSVRYNTILREGGLLFAARSDDLLSMWARSLSPSGLCYVIYTSGSSGRPKGVAVEHHNLTSFIAGLTQVAQIHDKPRVMQLAPFVFDACIAEVFSALTNGGTLCFSEHPKLLVGDYLRNVLELNRVNYLQCTPSIASTLSPLDVPPSLTLLGLAGESCPADLVSRWLSSVDVMVCYGPSECTVAVTSTGRMRQGETSLGSENLLGRPLPRCQVHILLPDTLETADLGAEGEMCVSGANVGRGYLDEAITAQKYIDHPSLGRLYRTGDKAKVLPDGNLAYLGRLDRQVKLRGLRIELGEIEEAALLAHCGISQVSAQILREQVFLFVAPSTTDTEAVQSSIASRVPVYMVPSRIIAKSSLPLTHNGKVDHAALARLYGTSASTLIEKDQTQEPTEPAPPPQMSSARPVANVNIALSSEAAKSPQEESSTLVDTRIANLWIDILQLDSIPIRGDAFFSLGGNSILLSSLSRKLEEVFGVRLSTLDLIRSPTLGSQIDLIQQHHHRQEADKARRTIIATTSKTSAANDLESGLLERCDCVEQTVSAAWQNILFLEDPPKASANFFDCGGNSISLSKLAASLNASFQLDPPLTLLQLIQVPTVHQMTTEINECISTSSASSNSFPEPDTKVAGSTHQLSNKRFATTLPSQLASDESGLSEGAIAVIGMGIRVPGGEGVDSFWQLLADGASGLSIDVKAVGTDGNLATYVGTKGLLKDPLKYGGSTHLPLSAVDLENMDPQIRLALTTAVEALVDAGHFDDRASFDSVGYFLGATPLTSHLANPTPPQGLEAGYGQLLSSNQANHICYHLDLRGPALTLNTACSSGMVGLKLAVDSLRSRQTDLALAAGTSLFFPQTGYQALAGGLLSPSGQCRSLSEGADGAIMADGSVTLVLRRLGDAIQARDRIHAVVKSVAWGNDGGRPDRAGYSVPSCKGQEDVLLRSWREAGITSTDQLSYVECHGSGTNLGDAMELKALQNAANTLNKHSVPQQSERRHLYVGSYKANLGNPQSASGLVGIVKSICAMSRHQLPRQPSTRYTELNRLLLPSNLQEVEKGNTKVSQPHVEGSVRLVVNTEPGILLENQDGTQITMGVSSFGIGGTGCHAVISSY